MYIVFDFDSTIISTEWLDLLAAISLSDNPDKNAILDEIAVITSAGMLGNMPFAVSLEKRLSLLQVNKDHIKQLKNIIVDHISPSFAAHKDFFATYKDNIYVVSGWFEEFIFPVTDFLWIERSNVFANRFVFDEKDAIVGCDTTRYTAQDQGKVQTVRELQLGNTDVVVVGDGVTDYEIKQAWLASLFGAYTENVSRAIIVEKADVVFQNMDAIRKFFEVST